MDFVKCLQNDMVVNIFKCLDPADVAQACLISPDWRDFIIGHEVFKQMCLIQFPPVADVVDVNVKTEVGSEGLRNHKVYACLLHTVEKLKSHTIYCVERKCSVSNYPSKGLRDHAIPEKLIFELNHDLCVITEIDIRPYREYLKGILLEEEGYSVKSVRFRMGFPKSATKDFKDVTLSFPTLNIREYLERIQLEEEEDDDDDDYLFKSGFSDRFGFSDSRLLPGDELIWTYTSPEFPINEKCQPLSQGGRGQQFKFPKSVLCVGGFVMIELLGRVQKDERTKKPYYIKIAGVNVLGRALSPAFEAEVEDLSGKFVLSYDASRLSDTLRRPKPVTARKFQKKIPQCACACSNSIEV